MNILFCFEDKFYIASNLRIHFCYFNRKNSSDTDNYYYNNHFIVLHDLLRELAIYESTLEPIEERKRLIIHTNENESEGGLDEKQQGFVIRILSNCFKYCVKHKPQQITARTLSISIG